MKTVAVTSILVFGGISIFAIASGHPIEVTITIGLVVIALKTL